VAEASGTAMNQLDDQGSPLPAESRGALRRGPCGKAGIVFAAVPAGGKGARFHYLDVTGDQGAAEVVDPDAAAERHGAHLFFDAACSPIVVRADVAAGLVEHARGAAGGWTSKPAGDVASAFGGKVSGLALLDGSVDPDGTIRIVASATAGGASRRVRGNRAAAAGSAWEFAAFDPPSQGEVSAWRADATGAVHAVFTKTVFPCDPCDMGMYYGRLPAGQAAWTVETVQASKWGDPDDQFATDPSLAVLPTGEPVVAASFVHRAITGSLTSSELRVYGRDGGAWCHETVATESDGYAGQDGKQFTGATPRLVLDGSARIHVAFGDLAQWHDGNNYSNGVQGQIRYAVRTGTGWTVATLFEQPGRIESPKPLVGLERPLLAVAADGAQVWAAGQAREWDTDSIYNPAAVGVTWKATVVRAAVQGP
jgi:hypothetical protein